MNKKEYINTIEKITVSEDKIAEMLAISKEVQTNNTKAKLVSFKYGLIMTASLTIAIICLYNLNFNKNMPKTEEYILLQNGKVFFNNVESVQQAKIALPDGAIETSWSFKQVQDYFETDFLPKYIPSSIKGNSIEDSVSIYLDKSESVVFDNISYHYGDSDERGLAVTVSKNKLPIKDEIFITNNTQMSNINDTDILILETSPNYYYASFLYDGVGYIITAYGISQSEFIKILQSIAQ
jgi:hypothetical protein